jgi:hypothetical protein
VAYKIFATDFLDQNGYGLVIVTDPIDSGNEHILEIHAFFSGNPRSYLMEELHVESSILKAVDGNDLRQGAFQRGKEHIYTTLNVVSPMQYQAMLAGFGFAFKEHEKNYLLQLHLRNLFDASLEASIESSTREPDLKSFIATIKALGRITSVRKI